MKNSPDVASAQELNLFSLDLQGFDVNTFFGNRKTQVEMSPLLEGGHLRAFVLQLCLFYLSLFGCQITERLLASLKVTRCILAWASSSASADHSPSV